MRGELRSTCAIMSCAEAGRYEGPPERPVRRSARRVVSAASLLPGRAGHRELAGRLHVQARLPPALDTLRGTSGRPCSRARSPRAWRRSRTSSSPVAVEDERLGLVAAASARSSAVARHSRASRARRSPKPVLGSQTEPGMSSRLGSIHSWSAGRGLRLRRLRQHVDQDRLLPLDQLRAGRPCRAPSPPAASPASARGSWSMR